MMALKGVYAPVGTSGSFCPTNAEARFLIEVPSRSRPLVTLRYATKKASLLVEPL